MHFLHTVRTLNVWSRALLVAFVLAFGSNGIAHALHDHDSSSATTSLHSTACGYCVSYDHLAHTPIETTLRGSVAAERFCLPPPDAPAPLVRARATAQPRAPPTLI